MELKSYLIDLLSNIIHDRLQMLSDINDDMKKVEDYKRLEEVFSNIDNISGVDNNFLKEILLSITDSETVDGIISNIDMIKIVQKGIADGLDLTLDESQIELIKGVYDIVNNFRVELEKKNIETKEYLDDFIHKCKDLSAEIGTGVVRSIDVLDSILLDTGSSMENIVNAKFEILANNNKNYNMNIDCKVKEEVDLRIILKDTFADFDLFNDLEKNILVSYGNIDNIKSMIEFIKSKNLTIDLKNLFILFLFSNVGNLSSIYDLSLKYNFAFESLFKVLGVFISKDNNLLSIIIGEYHDNSDYNVISDFEFLDGLFELFSNNILLLSDNGYDVKELINNNILSLIVPDLSKNITILHDVELSNRDFSVVVCNPFLATSKFSFEECGLADYLKNNPLRLCTSYQRLKQISLNIVNARKNGDIIFRSLSDKKSYWLAKNITSSEVI